MLNHPHNNHCKQLHWKLLEDTITLFTICECVFVCKRFLSKALHYSKTGSVLNVNPIETEFKHWTLKNVNKTIEQQCKRVHFLYRASRLQIISRLVFLRHYNSTLDGADSVEDFASSGHTRAACRPHRVWLAPKKGFPKPEAINGTHAGGRNSSATTRLCWAANRLLLSIVHYNWNKAYVGQT